jgi:Protein of unknown function (DUF3102)
MSGGPLTRHIDEASRFDYSSVSSSVAKFLMGQADRIRQQCVTSIIQIGKVLLEAKRHLSHGAFLQRVESEVRIPVRTAQAYMRVASWAWDKSATVAHLSPSALYLLSPPGTPESFSTEILRRAEAGEYVAPSLIREELKSWRSDEQQCRRNIRSPPQTETVDASVLEITVEANIVDDMAELVSILMERLPAADFARVRDIITSDALLSDPLLRQNLERAFGRRNLSEAPGAIIPISEAPRLTLKRKMAAMASKVATNSADIGFVAVCSPSPMASVR